MIDSTGISTTCLSRRKRVLKKSWSRAFLKLHALVGYSPQAGALAIVSAKVTAGNVADCAQLGRLLDGFKGGGEPLLADRGYDSRRNVEIAAHHGFKPVIKPRAIGMDRWVNQKKFKEFRRNLKLYRQRGIAEAVFGGIANRYGAMIRCKLPATRAVSVLLMAVAHNLRTLVRVRAMKEMGYFLFVGFIRQTRF
ncbi:MAG: transposase [Candidatus Hadarchaeum sp.]